MQSFFVPALDHANGPLLGGRSSAERNPREVHIAFRSAPAHHNILNADGEFDLVGTGGAGFANRINAPDNIELTALSLTGVRYFWISLGA